MTTDTSILLSVAAVACLGVGVYYIYKKQKGNAPLKIEKVDSLNMGDVVAWFKSLDLDATHHTPFVCNNLNMFKMSIANKLTPPFVLLGVYDEGKNSLAPYRLLELKSIDPSLKNLLDKSSNGLVVLS